MATVEEFVVRVLGFLLYWFYVIIFVCIIVKFVQMLMNIGGFGSGGRDRDRGGRDRGRGRDGDGRGGSTPGGSDDGEKDPGMIKKALEDRRKENERIKENIERAVENPAEVQFLVRGVDDEPLEAVEVKLIPTRRARRQAKKLGYNLGVYRDETNKSGLVPSEGGYWSIPSMPMKLVANWWPKSKTWKDVEYYKKRWQGLNKFFKYKIQFSDRIEVVTTFSMRPGDKATKGITIPVDSEKSANFRPEILEFRLEDVVEEDGSTSTTVHNEGILRRIG